VQGFNRLICNHGDSDCRSIVASPECTKHAVVVPPVLHAGVATSLSLRSTDRVPFCPFHLLSSA
jgi:hypothetical protein